MPQAAIKMFFLGNNWPAPAPSSDDHWYYYSMGRIILLFLWFKELL